MKTERDVNAEKLCAEALTVIGNTQSDYVYVIHHHKLNLQICLYDMMHLLTAIVLTPGGNSTVHIYTQTIHITKQSTQTIHRTTQLNIEQYN
jgi:hypothetical protein